MIRVLIVEDSPVVQQHLEFILKSDPSIEIVGIAENGNEAIEMVKTKKPDVITMDIHMPKLDGITATRLIMENYPTPIVIVSSSFLDDEVASTFQAVEAGALAVLHRPAGIGHPDFQKTASELITSVKLMSEVKVVKRTFRKMHATSPTDTNSSKNELPSGEKQKFDYSAYHNHSKVYKSKLNASHKEYKIVAIGASTGGPLVLQNILAGLGNDFKLPVLIVQHIANGFLSGFVEWLSQTTALPIHIAEHNKPILQGNIYIAPENFQMGIDAFNRIILSKDEPENGHCPSVSYLFRSVTKAFKSNAIGVLLSGMGKDGAKELKLMKDYGSVTIVQDVESSVVHGMPGEAIRLNGAEFILAPEEISMVLKQLVLRD